jgi:DNA-binding FadR family transcriptional regulator
MNELKSVRPANFMRLRQEGRTEEVARRLIELVELGLYSEGEQLPSESDLATQFGVATVTLRDALASLRERGVIETRRGRNGGSFVCGPPGITDEALLARLKAMSALELRDVCDEHVAISGAAARLAAQRSSAQHHVRLRFYIDALRQASSRPEQRRADARFHLEVAVAAQSVRLTHSEMSLQAELGELLWLSPAGSADVEGAVQEHRAIADAIAAADVNLAGALAEAHVTRGIKRLIQLRLQLLSGEV